MKFEPGVIVVAVAMLLFYLRLAQIRGYKRRQQRAEAVARARSRRKGRPAEPASPLPITYEVSNYFLLALGIVLMLGGILLRTTAVYPAFQPYWWLFVTAGVLVFIFQVK
jgi:hypothetical protein